VTPFCFPFLQVTAVGQHHAEQVASRLCREHRAAEALHHEARDQAGMVQVRVGEQHECDLARIEREAAVLRVGGASTLEHAAVHEELHLAGVDEVARAGDLAGRAQERQPHGFFFGGSPMR
jgi:hypothetical protein